MSSDDAEALVRAARARARGAEGEPATLTGAVTDRIDDPAAEAGTSTGGADIGTGTNTSAVAEAPRSALEGVRATGARRRRRKRSAARNAVEWVLVLAGALIVALIVKTWLFQAFYIPSESMEPTLAVGDRVLVNKISYDIDDVARGDIVVFERPESWGSGSIDDLIKRVIGLPGDTVEVRDGAVLIDGDPLEEPWLADGVTTPSFFQESGCVPSCVIAEDQVFVLGDNRNNSDASNHFGPLPFENVVGRAFIRVWPIGSIGTL